MPQLPPAPGVTRAVLQFRQDGQVLNNVMHFVDPSGVQPPDPTELASRVALWWITWIRTFVSNLVLLEQVICTDLSEGAEPGAVYTTGLPENGSNAAAPLPNNVTVVMSLRTALRGRSYRGRVYHIGLTESQVVGNTVDPALMTSLRANYTFLTNLEGDTGEPVYQLAVLSYFTNNAVRPLGVATPVVSISSDGVIDTQRRRLPGRGR